MYSNTNFTYMHPDAAAWLAARGVQHLLVDMPSIDREEDQGKLLAHHAFWNYPTDPRMEATITEMVFVDDSIADGLYLLNLQKFVKKTFVEVSKSIEMNPEEVGSEEIKRESFKNKEF